MKPYKGCQSVIYIKKMKKQDQPCCHQIKVIYVIFFNQNVFSGDNQVKKTIHKILSGIEIKEMSWE